MRLGVLTHNSAQAGTPPKGLVSGRATHTTQQARVLGSSRPRGPAGHGVGIMQVEGSEKAPQQVQQQPEAAEDPGPLGMAMGGTHCVLAVVGGVVTG